MTNPAWVVAAIGCGLIGYHFQSWQLGLGIYMCIAGLGNWIIS
jgi:hypothetical protein